MRFEAKFFDRNNFWVLFKKPTFYGKGFVHLQDTAMTIDGRVPKFNIFLIGTFYYRVLLESTTRTIPYAVITKYKKPHFLGGNYHEITYRLPSGKKSRVWFRMTHPRGKKNKSFSNKLNDYLEMMKSFTVA